MSLIVGISNQITAYELKNIDDYANSIVDAEVSVEIRDSLGDLVSGEFFPVNMEYSVVNYKGAYRANLAPSLGIVAGEPYSIEFTATTTDGLKLINKCTVIAESPGCGCS